MGCLSLSYKNIIDFCYWSYVLQLCWIHLLVQILFCGFLKIFCIQDPVICNRDNFTSPFPMWMPSISFSCLNALVKNYSIIFNISGVDRKCCLIPTLGESFQSFTTEYDVRQRFFLDALYQGKDQHWPLIPYLQFLSINVQVLTSLSQYTSCTLFSYVDDYYQCPI